jgi:hypothetical protein
LFVEEILLEIAAADHPLIEILLRESGVSYPSKARQRSTPDMAANPSQHALFGSENFLRNCAALRKNLFTRRMAN